jgi:flagellar export protein FliJ
VKRFEFRLDGVMRVRRIREDAARADVLRANHALNAADTLVAERETRYESMTRPSGPMTHDAHSRMRWSLEQAAAASVHATASRAAALANAEAARATWAMRRQDLRAIERLHDRALTAHRGEVRRAEDRMADELALARHRTGRQCP